MSAMYEESGRLTHTKRKCRCSEIFNLPSLSKITKKTLTHGYFFDIFVQIDKEANK
ncbi:MAG: hypothetical protein ACE5H1_09860 [Thermodesulfobacteriota bacterium]